MKELEGIWQCNEVKTDAAQEDCNVSIMLHITNSREDGLYGGYFVRCETRAGWARKLSLPVLVEVAACKTLIRLKSHRHEIVDELHILSVNTEELSLRSMINNQYITFKKDGK